MEDIVLKAEQISKTFGTGHAEICAVDNVSLDVRRSELVLIMGPSGSGKTTLLSIFGALLRPTAGTIDIEGIRITDLGEEKLPPVRATKIGFIFQAFNLLDALTVEDNILFPAGLLPGGLESARQRAGHLIDRLALTKRRHALPKTLSGGEKQRVAIARALINKPPLILADEPTGNLDSHNGQEVMMILQDIIQDEECSVVMVTHDPRVEEVADRILWLEDGSLRDRKAEHHNWVIDPVCGMRVDEWTAEVFIEYQNARYVFCSRRCLEKFNEKPDQYISK